MKCDVYHVKLEARNYFTRAGAYFTEVNLFIISYAYIDPLAPGSSIPFANCLLPIANYLPIKLSIVECRFGLEHI